MAKSSKSIPVKTFPTGIYIGRMSLDGFPEKNVEISHRDNGHLFILQEKGTTHIEIDFQKQIIEAPAVIYIPPFQVHRLILFENATICSWIITNENLQPEHLKLLEDLTPVKTLTLMPQDLSVISQTASLCIELSERKQEKLYNSILKGSCNTLVALIASQYLAQFKSTENNSRFEVITKAFKSSLEHYFATIKSPTEYAKFLNISASYLNECVKGTTGHSVSFHIKERVILEAKRLLYYTDKSVKEIAFEIGYEDYSYFTRLFTKTTGTTPLAFRSKNLE